MTAHSERDPYVVRRSTKWCSDQCGHYRDGAVLSYCAKYNASLECDGDVPPLPQLLLPQCRAEIGWEDIKHYLTPEFLEALREAAMVYGHDGDWVAVKDFVRECHYAATGKSPSEDFVTPHIP